MSCSGDGMIYHTDIITAQETSSSCFDCHDGAVYEVCVVSACVSLSAFHTVDHSN